MTTRFENRLFRGLTDGDSGRIVEDVECIACDFASSSISMGREPKLRTVVRRARLLNCRVRASFVGSPVLEDVAVDGLDTGTEVTLHTYAAVFRHVVLKGRIGKMDISGEAPSREDTQARFDDANRAFYRDVDWALDISKAEFQECAPFACVPAHLVRRDPETQVVLRRERLRDDRWKSLELEPYLSYILQRYASGLELGAGDSMVLVAAKRCPRFGAQMQSIRALQRAGFIDHE